MSRTEEEGEDVREEHAQGWLVFKGMKGEKERTTRVREAGHTGHG